MSPTLTKVVYKHDSDVYIIIVNPIELKKYKAGDTSIPLTDVVESFTVWLDNQGILGKPSQQQLDTVFGTHKDLEVVEFMLKNGKEQHGDGISSTGNTNITRGSGVMDRSKGLSGI